MTRYIDADALLKAIANYPYGYRGMIESVIENQPTVDAEPIRHGKWMPLSYDSGGYWKCSSCETPTEASGANLLYKYCPYCGARMDEE